MRKELILVGGEKYSWEEEKFYYEINFFSCE